jgi:phosphoribosylformimino-5-aminoimidazole carboxamide ribotide isomerase
LPLPAPFVLHGSSRDRRTSLVKVIPVLDVRRGSAVHAAGGDRALYRPLGSILASGCDPLTLARACRQRLGADSLYLADLDAIESGGVAIAPSARLVRRLAENGVRVWIDAGTNDEIGCAALLDAGADQVVVGLETLRDPAALGSLPRNLDAGRLALSLDLRGGRPLAPALRAPLASCVPAVNIADPPASTVSEIVQAALAGGFSTLIALDLDRVGSGTGPDFRLLESERRRAPGVGWIAGGGVRDPADLRALAEAGWVGCLVGTAIHEGRVRREDVLDLASVEERRPQPAASDSR